MLQECAIDVNPDIMPYYYPVGYRLKVFLSSLQFHSRNSS
jgi:hypothetical protein